MKNTSIAKRCWDTLGHAVFQTCGVVSQSKKPDADQIPKARESPKIRIQSNYTCLFVTFNMFGWKNGVVNEPLAVRI